MHIAKMTLKLLLSIVVINAWHHYILDILGELGDNLLHMHIENTELRPNFRYVKRPKWEDVNGDAQSAIHWIMKDFAVSIFCFFLPPSASYQIGDEDLLQLCLRQ